MARDIEDFLRRAAERRKQNQAPQQSAHARKKPPKPIPTLEPAAKKKSLAQQAPATLDPYAQKQKPSRNQPSSKSKEPQKPNHARRQSIEATVGSATGTGGGQQSPRQLGDKIGQHDRFESGDKFDHSMGALEGTETVTDDETAKIEGPDVSQLAIDLIDLLREPKTIRQSILISEILKRPDFDNQE